MIMFIKNFLACVVGKVQLKWNVKKSLITKFMSNSDEAFALLVLENGWDEWIKIDAHEHFISK